MKVEAIVRFMDSVANAPRELGDVFEADKKRAKSLVAMKMVKEVKAKTETKAKKAEKATEAKVEKAK